MTRKLKIAFETTLFKFKKGFHWEKNLQEWVVQKKYGFILDIPLLRIFIFHIIFQYFCYLSVFWIHFFRSFFYVITFLVILILNESHIKQSYAHAYTRSVWLNDVNSILHRSKYTKVNIYRLWQKLVATQPGWQIHYFNGIWSNT